MLQEQPNEKDAPQASGFSPWQAHVRLNDREVIRYDMDVIMYIGRKITKTFWMIYYNLFYPEKRFSQCWICETLVLNYDIYIK